MDIINNLSNAKRSIILVILLVAAFITAMSTTVTGNMIPNLMAYFSVSSSMAQWLTSGATLLSGIIIPITAFLIKIIPNRSYFILAMGFFSIGSFGSGIANHFGFLLICRLVQALGCGMLLSFAQVLILSIYPKEKHGTMMAAYAMASSVSSMIGPTYAGLLMDHVGWRGVFISLLVVGIILVVLGVFFMQDITPKQEASINIQYILLSSIGFASLIIGINQLNGGLFRIQSGGAIMLGLLLITFFALLQLKSDKPMLNLWVCKYSSFRLGVYLTFCLYLICMGNGVILPIIAKTICGFSDTAYGIATIVGALISVFATLFSGQIYDKVGLKPMAIVSVIFFTLFTILGLHVTSNITIIYIGAIYAVQSIAMALLISPTITFALSGLSKELRVDGSAIFNTLRQLSSAIASTIAVLLFSVFGSDIKAIKGVYFYYGIVTICIAFLVLMYIVQSKKQNESN